MPRSARYHIDRAKSIVFTSKRLPLRSVSSERSHQVAEKFRKMSCLNVYVRKRGRVGVKQCLHSFHSLDCLLGVFSYDYMSKLFPIFCLANFVCFHPSKNKGRRKLKLCLFFSSFCRQPVCLGRRMLQIHTSLVRLIYI